jgi:serine/threonine protein kinase
MKFMMQREQFSRELQMRSSFNLSSSHVLAILDAFDADSDLSFAQSLHRVGMERYRFCVTMPAADRSLKSIIDSEHLCGRDWDAIKLICVQLCKCLEHMHACHVVHGDIKPLNVVRVSGRMLIIDLDASTPLSHSLGYKSSAAYVPPEMLYFSEECEAARGALHLRRHTEQHALLAAPSFDIWSLGAVFFQLFCGETLFLHFRLKKLSKISHPMARHLLSLMLVEQPSLRLPTIAHVLSHSFFTGLPQRRLAEQRPQWDVFIS